MKRLALVALLLVGCAEGGDMGAPDGTGGTGSVGGAGGTGGAGGAAAGTGGTSTDGPFTAADKTLCEDWPVCPDGVVSPGPQLVVVESSTCPLQGNGSHVACGGCINIKNNCGTFFGRCKAPNWNASDGSVVRSIAGVQQFDSCQNFIYSASLARSSQPDRFVICTGDVAGSDVGAATSQTVCGP